MPSPGCCQPTALMSGDNVHPDDYEVAACGISKRGKPDNVPATLRELSYPDIPSLRKIPKEIQAHPCLDPQVDPCAPAHNEFICHSMGEKRQHYLREVKRILDRMETAECPTKDQIQAAYGTGGGGAGEYDRPMLKYPGYLDIDSPKYKKPFFAPLITHASTKEVRPTDVPLKHRHENSSTLQYIPVEEAPYCHPWALPRQKSFELRGGIMFKGCDCDKHNGLQDRCERTDCNGAPPCLTQPEPSCLPSQAFIPPPRQRPVADMIREVISIRQKGPANKTYCCCPIESPNKYREFGGKKYTDCDHAGGPGKFDCYKCRQ